jgi:cytochrome c oxidase assembly protein subunit 11
VVAAIAVDRTRLVTVQFDATVNSGLAWTFKPKLHSIQVHPGELTEVWYEARNTTSGSVVGNAVPSVAPSTASMYFNKTECFCFTEQRLDAGESRDMPVRFMIDPKLPPEVQTVTLGYVFYRNDTATRQLANASAVAPPAS